MSILLAFAPFIIFALLIGVIGAAGALAAGAVASASLLLHGHLKHTSPKILEIGTFVVFAALSIYCLITGGDLSIVAAKLLVDIGLLAIAIVSMIAGTPFTLQYAKEEVPPELWNSPVFLRTNYVISGVWALAFLVMVVAEAALIYLPQTAHRIGIITIILALVGALKFTKWYPQSSWVKPQ